MKSTHLCAVVLSALSVTRAQSTTDATDTSATSQTAVSSTTTTTTTPELTDTSILETTASDESSTVTSIIDVLTTYTTTDAEGVTVTITSASSSTVTDITSSVIVSTNSTTISNSTSATTASNRTSTSTRSSSTLTPVTLPTSTDASKYLSFAFPAGAPQPTWATGEYYTMLASALYSVDRSFIQRSDYQTIISAINSAADNAGSQVSASVEASAWGWGKVTTNTWYQTRVPGALQTEVLEYNSAWNGAASSVKAIATAAKPSSTAAAPPRCTGMVFAGMAAGVAGAVIGVV